MDSQTAISKRATRPTGAADGESRLWVELAGKLFRAYPGTLGLRVGRADLGQFGQTADMATPQFSLALRGPEVLRRLVFGRDPLRFADAYFRGALDIEGDLFAALSLKDHLHDLRLSARDRLRMALRALHLPRQRAAPGMGEAGAPQAPDVREHTKAENREAIAFHYDVSNEFYALWLDPAMVYSCAYFETPSTDLATAQCAKLDHICRKLQLRPGERLLDIGCGWGALVIHAARHYGVQAHGITLSERQLALARTRIAAAGLADRIAVELRDYRDLGGAASFDKVASVGMFEHVGLKNLRGYFARVFELLKPGGLFLNHGITHDEEGWGEALSARFINRYVFPDGELDLLSNVQRRMELEHFEIVDVEGLRAHYALTLRHWVRALEARRDEALVHVDESTWRVWRLYMAASALEFEAGELGIYQILACRRSGQGRPTPAGWPLTRRHLYTGQTAQPSS